MEVFNINNKMYLYPQYLIRFNEQKMGGKIRVVKKKLKLESWGFANKNANFCFNFQKQIYHTNLSICLNFT